MECQQILDSRSPQAKRTGYLKRILQGYFGMRRRTTNTTASILVRVVSPEAVVIRNGELCVIEFSERCTIACTGGKAWVTFPGRFCDYIIDSGESLSLRGAGKIVVSGGTEEVRLEVKHCGCAEGTGLPFTSH